MLVPRSLDDFGDVEFSYPLISDFICCPCCQWPLLWHDSQMKLYIYLIVLISKDFHMCLMCITCGMAEWTQMSKDASSSVYVQRTQFVMNLTTLLYIPSHHHWLVRAPWIFSTPKCPSHNNERCWVRSRATHLWCSWILSELWFLQSNLPCSFSILWSSLVTWELNKSSSSWMWGAPGWKHLAAA